MANAKRQRQDELRTLKRQAEQTAAKKQAQRRKFQRIGLIGGLAVVAVVVLTLLTRGGDSDDTAAVTVPSTSQPTVVTASPQLQSAPDVTVPDGEPPKELGIKDLVVGTGDTVKVGDTVRVQYTGKSWSTKEQFDSSWSNGGQPFEVTNVGTDQAPVIQGWAQGLVGAKVGSRRQLVIPPALGYGETGSGDVIKPGETLVFVVDIVSTARGAGTAVPSATVASATTTATATTAG